VASGGFSGATQVALDLTVGGQAHHETLLVLRHKRRTPMARVQALREQGVPLELVTGWNHLSTIAALSRLCQRWKPNVVVGHGFPEHLLARWAARRAGVPVLVQVEHNMRERYNAFKRWQLRQLAPHTAAFVGVSDAVSGVLRDMGLPPSRVRTLRNGTALQPFAHSDAQPWAQREPALFMAARFGAQKDHDTLIRSLVPLARDHGLRPALLLAGGGSARHLQAALALVHELGLQDRVSFLGHRPDVPQLLMRHQVAVLSTHYEGLPLSLAEAMAAGCAVVGSDVAAVRETLGDGQWGWLARAGDPQSWADTLAALWRQPQATAEKAAQAREHARVALSRERMVNEYAALFDELCGASVPVAASAPQPTLQPWLSVLIPAHNAGAYLDEALRSVVSQLDAQAEVLVFNDGSTDQTAESLERWKALQDAAHAQGHGPQLRVWHLAQSGGVSAARNALLEAACGKWLWFIDADDRVRPGAVAQLQRLVQHKPELQAVVVDHAVLRAAPSWKHRLRGEGHRRSLPQASGAIAAGPALMHGLMAGGQWHVWGKVLRADAWPADLRFPAQRVFEDLSVVPRLMAGIERAWYLAEPLVEYRSNPGSILGSMNPAKLHDWALALDDLSRAPSFDTVWADFTVQQALRLHRVARRLNAPLPWWPDWWAALGERQALFRQTHTRWLAQPRRWVSWLQLHRLMQEQALRSRAPLHKGDA
jgi:glycosyltransferase involved in cell wall biosynthesis